MKCFSNVSVQEEKERREKEEARKKQDEDAKKKKALSNRNQQYGGVQQRVGRRSRTRCTPTFGVCRCHTSYVVPSARPQQDARKGAKRQTEREKKRKILADRKKPLNVDNLNEDKVKWGASARRRTSPA